MKVIKTKQERQILGRQKQADLIFSYLSTGKKLDQLTAKFVLGCEDLPEVISGLILSGVNVKKELVSVGRNTKIFQYSLSLFPI